MHVQVDPATLEEVCGESPGWLCERVLDWTGSEFLARAFNWFVDVPLTILLILLLAFFVNRLVRRAIRRVTDRIAEGEPPSLRQAARAKAIGDVLRSIASVVVYSIAVMLVLGELGVNLAPLIAGAGIAGVALGFGAQSLVKDFISGLFMMIEDQYGVGDVIDVGDAVGTVEKITLRSTRIRDVNGTTWYVPNGEILRVANKSQGWARAVLDVPIAYGTNIDQAQEVINRVAAGLTDDEAWSPKVIEPPEVWGVESIAADSMAIRVVVKTDPAAAADVQRELRRRLVEAFVAEGIKMPQLPPGLRLGPAQP
jgi:moderate conductance mechanosensitive channel